MATRESQEMSAASHARIQRDDEAFQEPDVGGAYEDGDDAEQAAGAQSSRRGGRRMWMSSSIWKTTESFIQFLSIFLHVFLIGVNIALLVVVYAGEGHHEHSITVSVGHKSNILSEALPIILQTIGVLYFAAMVTTCQKLSTRLVLLGARSLSEAREKLAAWTSIGAATTTLTRHWTSGTFPLGVLAIVLYLAGMAVLHITTASLITVQLFDTTVPATVNSTLALQNICEGSNSYPCGESFDIIDVSKYISAFSFLDYEFPGLSGNTVYDVLDFSNATRNVAVSATTFTVACGTVSGSSWISECYKSNASETPNQNGFTSCILVEANEDNGLPYDIYLENPSIVGDTIISGTTPKRLTESDVGQNISAISEDAVLQASVLLYTTYTITDLEGTEGPSISIGATDADVDNITLLGCTLTETNHTVHVDPQTKMANNLTELNLGTPQSGSTFAPWTWEVKTGSQIMDHFQYLFSDALPDAEDKFFCPLEGSFCQSTVDTYLSNDDTPDLATLEARLANVTAIMNWLLANPQTNFAPLISTIIGEQDVTSARINISTVPLLVGSVISFLLLPLGIFLMGLCPSQRRALRRDGSAGIHGNTVVLPRRRTARVTPMSESKTHSDQAIESKGENDAEDTSFDDGLDLADLGDLRLGSRVAHGAARLGHTKSRARREMIQEGIHAGSTLQQWFT